MYQTIPFPALDVLHHQSEAIILCSEEGRIWPLLHMCITACNVVTSVICTDSALIDLTPHVYKI